MTAETLHALQEVGSRLNALAQAQGTTGMAWLQVAWWTVDQYITEQLHTPDTESGQAMMAQCREIAARKLKEAQEQYS